jgi:hypothetical protein
MYWDTKESLGREENTALAPAWLNVARFRAKRRPFSFSVGGAESVMGFYSFGKRLAAQPDNRQPGYKKQVACQATSIFYKYITHKGVITL